MQNADNEFTRRQKKKKKGGENNRVIVKKSTDMPVDAPLGAEARYMPLLV